MPPGAAVEAGGAAAGQQAADALAARVAAASQGASAQTDADSDGGEGKPLVLQPVAKVGGESSSAQPLPASPSGITPTTDGSPLPSNLQPVAPQSPAAGSLQATLQADAAAAREADNAAVNNARLARGLASAVNQRGGAVTLRLTPPEMGTVRIQMQLAGATLSASVFAETASAHQMLSQQLGQLRTSLEAQGLHVERLSVQPMQQPSPGSASEQNGDSQQQQQNSDGRSRGQQGYSRGQRDDTSDPDGRNDYGRDTKRFSEHLDDAPADSPEAAA